MLKSLHTCTVDLEIVCIRKVSLICHCGIIDLICISKQLHCAIQENICNYSKDAKKPKINLEFPVGQRGCGGGWGGVQRKKKHCGRGMDIFWNNAYVTFNFEHRIIIVFCCCFSIVACP